MAEEKEESLEYTSTWRLATVCFMLVTISSLIATGIHRLGKILKRKKMRALYASLEKMKEELMLIGFISLFITAFQGPINHICIPKHSTKTLLPCKKNVEEDFSIERLSSKVGHCEKKGMEPFLSIEGMHQLDIFIFILAITHIIFCVSTMLLASIKIYSWKQWEEWIKNNSERPQKNKKKRYIKVIHHSFIKKHFPYEMSLIKGWVISFFKHFWGSVNQSDYTTIRLGFIKNTLDGIESYNFHKYMIRTLEEDFKKVVGIRCHLWVFVIIFLLLNNHGWHMYFYISFIPLILLLALGTKLQHIMFQLAQEFAQKNTVVIGDEIPVQPSNDHFWFKRPKLLLDLIQFILFQNAFEIAFFFWVLTTYGFRSCIMGKVGYLIPRLVIGLIVQVLCSYSTLPLYALVSQMVSKHKNTVFSESVREGLVGWQRRSQERIKRAHNPDRDRDVRDVEMLEI